MQSLDPATHSHLLIHLDELAQSQRTARKILVCGYTAEGRELLRALALAGRSWIGYEPTDARRFANELVAHDIVRDGLRLADSFDLLALLDQAIDETVARSGNGLSPEIRSLADQVGFRKAIKRSIDALRLEGIDSPSLRCASIADLRKRNFLADIYAAYEDKLRLSKLADTAEVYRRAAHGLSRGTIHLPRATIVLLPGVARHGLARRFIECLRSRGAKTPGDDDAATTSCKIEIFAASSPLHEIKEVLRLCLARGLHWDEVEIIATDDDVYACALDSIVRRMNIPVSYAVGLPASRTRPGRVVAAYLRWISDDFSDEIMRALLESGDILPPADLRNGNGVSLARTLRKLRIGWGRDRYLDHITAAELEAQIEDRESASADDEQRRLELLRDLDMLRDLFTHILAATPRVASRAQRSGNRISPAALAGGLLAVLECTVTDHEVDKLSLERVQAKLERIRATMRRAMTFESAVAVVRERLDIRVPAVGASGPAPWTSAPGHIHLSSLTHGGFTGRKATFIVGLDAGRFPRVRNRDPLLSDEDRNRISATLQTSAERLSEAQEQFAALFARLRGDVTISFSSYDAVEGRKLSPAAVVLDAFRLMTDDENADYDALRKYTKSMAGAVPHANRNLDTDDVWLSAMAEDGVLRTAQHAVRSVYAGLDRGLKARDARTDRVLNSYHGLVTPHDVLDPRVNGDVVSPSRLEALGTCALRYFYRYVLGIKPPEIPVYDPEVWLDPRSRGSLLHEVYEFTLRAARDRNVEILSSELDDVACEMLEAACDRWRVLVPPPSQTVFEREAAELRSDVAAFTAMCRSDGANWCELEFSFDTTIDVNGRELRVQGRVDRIDELDGGRLLVIDYKTGHPARYQNGIYDGGRRLQHYLYSLAVEKLKGKPVARMEYRFPTARAEGANAPFDAISLASGGELVSGLLDAISAGRFLPTDDPADCGYCDFRDCCRVTTVKGDTHSPLALWARNLAPVPDAQRALVELKGRFR